MSPRRLHLLVLAPEDVAALDALEDSTNWTRPQPGLEARQMADFT
jgi:hypothetical protein